MAPLVQCERKLKGKSIAQNTIYKVALASNDERLIRLCENYDFLSAEAHYHKECYLKYIKTIDVATEIRDSSRKEEQSPYFDAYEEASGMLFQFITNEIINKNHVVFLTDLTALF